MVLSGPSGVGKDTLLNFFLSTTRETVRLVTCTTRPPRPGEENGKDYWFVSPEEFSQMESQGQMLESATVYGYSYGSPRKLMDEHLDAGRNVILKIDVQGGLSVKERLPEAVMVFLAPPSMEELQRRLTNRRTEAPEDLERRIRTAASEMDLIPQYHYLIVHDRPDEASRQLQAVITAERARIVTDGKSS